MLPQTHTFCLSADGKVTGRRGVIEVCYSFNPGEERFLSPATAAMFRLRLRDLS